MPFPWTKTIHPDWSKHNQPVADGSLNGSLDLARPVSDDSGWDPKTGPTGTTAPTHIYTGAFRAQALQTNVNTVDAAGQTVTVRAYLIVITALSPEPMVGDRITVTDSPDDLKLVGKVLTITGVTYSSRRFERDIYADLDLSNQPEE